MRNLISPGILIVGVTLATAASADVTMKLKETHDLDKPKQRVSTSTLMFNATSMATRRDGADTEQSRVIFRGDKDLMWLIHDDKKSYQQIDKAMADQIAAQMEAAQAQMKAQLDQLPPDQRAKAEEMMKKYGGSMPGQGADLKLEYRKTGETRMINGQRCTKYDTYWGKDLTSYAWVAPYSALKLTPADAAVFKKMGEFAARLTGSLGKSQQRDLIPMHELGGIPLLTQQLDHGKVTSETQIESVTRSPLPAGTFDLPQGYKVQPMPQMDHK